VPLVVDGYGDDDTQLAAKSYKCLPQFVSTGITRSALSAALADLSTASPNPPLGLVLSAGFEDRLLLAAALADEYEILGTSATAISRCKTPADFFPTIARLGIPHPETRFEPPASPTGWLTKKAGGSGGAHIHETTAAHGVSKHGYFQRKVPGDAISVFGIVSAEGDAFAFSRQWITPTLQNPFRYGGATGPLTLEEDLEARLIDTCMTLSREFNLKGIVSFDFLINDGEPLLIEINPRPGATLDVFDDERGTVFAAHIAACMGENPATLLQRQWDPPAARAAAYLYADQGALRVPKIAWPEWARDCSPAGTLIAVHNPIATVLAEATTPDAAEQLCFERMGQLQSMLYDSAKAEQEPTL